MNDLHVLFSKTNRFFFFIRHVVVMLKSMMSEHFFSAVRPRTAEKLEMVKFDPYGMFICVFSYLQSVFEIKICCLKGIYTHSKIRHKLLNH